MLVAVMVTVVVYGALLFVTAFLACGVSGCSGAGYGPAFSPSEAQVGLIVAGASLVPLTLLLLRGRRRLYQVAGASGVILAGSMLAMVLLGLGPNGCPSGQSRATTRSDAYLPGSLTCSSDRDAVPPN